MSKQVVYAGSRGLERLQDRVAKHATKAIKLGQAPPTIESRLVAVIPFWGCEFQNDKQFSVYKVTVCGSTPHINGWDVVARIEPVDGGNLVHCTPGVDSVDPKWRTWGNKCQHCDKKRKRNDLVILRDGDGHEMAVGRNCLADFLGCEGQQVNLSYWFDEVKLGGDDYLSGGMMEVLLTPMQALVAASALIRKHGWVSRAMADQNETESTSSLMWYWLRKSEKYIKESGQLVADDTDVEIASSTIAWCLEHIDSDKEYTRNLALLCQQQVVEDRQLGYIASAIPAWQRATQERVERESKQHKPKEWVDGEKVKSLPVKVLRTKVIPGYMGGLTTIISMVAEDDDNQYPLVWFATGLHEYQSGDEVLVSGTVKDRNEHEKYGKQTILTRCKIS
jgi:hypothetical protein